MPIVAGLAPVEMSGGRHGFFLMCGPCTIELLVGPFDFEHRALTEKPADGPGMPLEVPAAVAERLGLHLGDEVSLPGHEAGAAHLGWTFPEFDKVAGLNGGNVLFAPDAGKAAGLLGQKGFVTAAFVVGQPGSREGDVHDLTARAREIAGDVADIGRHARSGRRSSPPVRARSTPRR